MMDSARHVSILTVGLMIFLMCFGSIGLVSAPAHADDGCNGYIYGMHDYNSTVRDLLTYNSERRGWVLVLQSLDGYTGGYNSDVVNAANDGLGTLVRLHWGYGTTGTLPPQSQYDTFASRASTFIQTHIDYCKFYQIGNEPNLCAEWPGGGAADGRCNPDCSSVREWITADRYADCFQRVYNALPTSLKSEAKLCLQPAAVWAGFFRCEWDQDFDTDDFICYTQQCYDKIPHYMIGGLTFHPKTHNHNPGEITLDDISNPAFGCAQNESVYWYFWVYKDLLDDIPTDLRDRGIFFTELNPHEGGWTNNNNGYCVAAYNEVDYWNSTHSDRKITGMMLYRWDDGDDRWDIHSRPGVQQDLQAAVAQGQTSNGIQVCAGGPPPPTNTPTPTPHPPSGDNLSQGKAAYASSQYGPEWGPEKAVDGVISSSYKWCSQSETPTWWYVDLGQICDINTVKVYCESYVGEAAYYNLREYTVRASNTTSVPVSSWLTISSYDSGGGDGAGMVQHSVSGAYRYVGLHITDSGIDNYSRVLEVQVFGNTDPPTFRVEAEDYDNYYDTTSGNSGGAYRSDDVDIEAVQNDDGRYDVGWTDAGEWLDFSINVAASYYHLYVRHAGTSNGSIHIELNGEDVTGSISLPSTGGWQTWATKDAGTIYIGSGNRTLRIYEETAGYNINYLRFEPTAGPGSEVMAEAGYLNDNVTHNPVTVNLNHAFANPVVFAQPVSTDGGDTSITQITNVTSNSFQVYVDEAPNKDGAHTTEAISWVVFEAGEWDLDGLKLEVGTISTSKTVGRNVSNQWYTVNLSEGLSGTPVVITQRQTENEAYWAKTRITSVGGSSFQTALEESEADTQQHGAAETIGWLAMEAGTGETADSHLFEAGHKSNVTHTKYSTVSFSQSFASAPAFIAWLQTYNGGDNCGLRFSRTSLSSTGVDVWVEEDTTYDSETNHTNETVGFFAVEGSGQFTFHGVPAGTPVPTPTSTPVPTSTPGGLLPITEDFESMPSWSSSYDAGWGSAATWSIQSGGQSGNYLQASRSSQGSSAKVLVFDVPTNTDITISIYMRCPSFGGSYWMETGYRLGNHTAQDFDENAGSWTIIQKFANDGTNGNGNSWVEYQKEVNTGSNTQISIGFKLGSSGGGGPTVGWDTLVIDESQYFGFETPPFMEFIGWKADESTEPGVSEVGRACEAMPGRRTVREDS